MTITNKTKRPITVPLPGGKTLHLGPGKSAQITAKASDHPPLKKLVESGDVELDDGGRGPTPSGGGRRGSTRNPGHRGTGGIRYSGDR